MLDFSGLKNWKAPQLPDDLPHGDMPGDKVAIGEEHIRKAQLIFPELVKEMEKLAEAGRNKIVVTVCGGSGVGKSEIASLLTYYLCEKGIGSYTLSGDNYPHRIPQYNDAERLHVFREGAIRNMLNEGAFSEDRFAVIHELQMAGTDAEEKHTQQYPWYCSYLSGGRKALQGYLGTEKEIDFPQLTEIIRQFKAGKKEIWLKRMGRTDTELWYECVDFSETDVLLIEWTHGNSDNYAGVDIPILLNSTPRETLAHRRARNRDGATDSAFTTLVLELEQIMLRNQAVKAKIIVSKAGNLLDYEEYCHIMEDKEDGSET